MESTDEARTETAPGSGSEARSAGRAAIWIGISALVVLIGPWIPIPGIQTEMLTEQLRALNASHVGPVSALFSALGVSIGVLVLVRLTIALLGKTESAPARTVGLVLYLLATAVQAFSLALWAETLNHQSFWGDVVPEPGWAFRLQAVLACTAGATVLWWLADRIDATRAASGALALSLVVALQRLLLDASAFGDAVADGTRSPLVGLIHLALPLAMIALAAVLALRSPASWPVKLTGSLELRSAFDVLAPPAAIATLAGTSVGSFTAPELARAALVVVGTVGLAVVLHARIAPGGRRSLWPAALGFGALAAVMGVLSLGLVSSGAIKRALEPGPLEGEARFEITLGAVDRFSDGEAEAMIARLNQLGAEARLVSADAQRITIRVEAARDIPSVLDALRPRALTLQLVDDLPSVPLSPGLVRASFGEAIEGPCETLRVFAPSSACHAALETLDTDELGGQPERCSLYCLEPTAAITGADVTEARAALDPYSNAPIVRLTLTPDAATRLERLTSANTGRQLAIVLDGRVLSAPVIQSAIPGGEIQITLGYAASLEQASTLASALGGGSRLTGEWVLEREAP